MTESRPPFPPFTRDTALQKVQAAEDAWNTRDPEQVSLAYTPDSRWCNRDEYIVGRDQIVAFLTRKWQRELDYSLRKSLWDFHDNRIAVRFQYVRVPRPVRPVVPQLRQRAVGVAESGLMARREASIPTCRSTSRSAVTSGRARSPNTAGRFRSGSAAGGDGAGRVRPAARRADRVRVFTPTGSPMSCR
ncbi:hypothetical protein MLM_0333 [Mycobacterium lepraemurium]|nr:hypothetical protein MLM_0333 [Mycobacterium lepraemurium]